MCRWLGASLRDRRSISASLRPNPDGFGLSVTITLARRRGHAADGTRGPAVRTLTAFARRPHRGRAFSFPRGTLALAGGRGDGWPPGPRARRRAGRSPQGCVCWWRRQGGAVLGALPPAPFGATSAQLPPRCALRAAGSPRSRPLRLHPRSRRRAGFQRGASRCAETQGVGR